MSNDALILELSSNLRPVRRRSSWRDVGLLFLVCALELALVLGAGLMRPDMGTMIGSGYMLWKLGGLALLAVISVVVAVRSFSPVDVPGRGLRNTLVLAGLMMAVGLLFGLDSVRSVGALPERLSPVHGMMCALAIMVMALPILTVMTLLMRSGAPTYPKASALASGLASGFVGALIFAFCCPVNDALYVVVWYATGCAAVTAMARWLLPGRFRL